MMLVRNRNGSIMRNASGLLTEAPCYCCCCCEEAGPPEPPTACPTAAECNANCSGRVITMHFYGYGTLCGDCENVDIPLVQADCMWIGNDHCGEWEPGWPVGGGVWCENNEWKLSASFGNYATWRLVLPNETGCPPIGTHRLTRTDTSPYCTDTIVEIEIT